MSNQGTRVLVIDDDEIARETMISFLEDAGFWVTGLPSPIGATKVIVDNAIEVVVLDILMPSMRGDRLAALLRQNRRLSGLGVILTSGAGGDIKLRSLAEQVDADGIISKGELDQLPLVVTRARRRKNGGA